MLKRLERIERQAHAAERAALEALSDAELDALIATFPPDPAYEAAVERLSDVDLERALAGELDRAAILRLGGDSMQTLNRRLTQLEGRAPDPDPPGQAVAEIAHDLPRYWIDGVAVDPATFARRAPRGAFVVDVGEPQHEPND